MSFCLKIAKIGKCQRYKEKEINPIFTKCLFDKILFTIISLLEYHNITFVEITINSS